MQHHGKILFYNAAEGSGLIITSAHQKFAINIAEWDDFDALPETGMMVRFEADGGTARSIAALQGAAAPAPTSILGTPKAPAPVFDPDAPPLASIRLYVSPAEAIEEYFERIERHIQEHTQYKTAVRRLDFLRIRRFLFTTYNNLTELDVHFITPELKLMRDDLMQMSKVYDDYKTKATYPDIAFDKVFLSRQPDYVYLRQDSEYSHNELKRLHGAEQMLSETIEAKEQVLNRTLKQASQFPKLEEEFKELKKNYVDTVHMIASLDDRYRETTRLMKRFEKEHQNAFFEQFTEASRKYRKQILYILDAQAFLFDDLLWRQARQSKVIKHYFEKAHIQGEYCAKTYLKYYLNTLDPELISTEQQELFELYEYLESLDHGAVMVLVHDIDDALRLKYLLAKVDAALKIETFVDERKALAWAQANQPSIVIIEDQLPSFGFGQFLAAYRKKITELPAVLLLSNLAAEQFDDGMIETVLRKGYSDKELLETVRKLMTKDEEDG